MSRLESCCAFLSRVFLLCRRFYIRNPARLISTGQAFSQPSVLDRLPDEMLLKKGSTFKIFRFLVVTVGLWTAASYATVVGQILPADQVFQISTQKISAKTIAIHWMIKPGYYLYRDKIHVHGDPLGIQTVVLPPGVSKHNALLGDYQIYPRGVTVLVKFAQALPATTKLTVAYQGCAAAGFCYPPMIKIISLQLVQNGLTQSIEDGPSHAVSARQAIQNNAFGATDTRGKAVQLLAHHNLWLILSSFFGFGVLLSLTPCVLPLIPVVSAIVLGHRRLTTFRAFLLSGTYVFAMAVTYAIAGVCAGLAGSYLQAVLQSPWVIALVSLVFISMALSLFGLYELHLPSSWQEKLVNFSNHQKGGNYLGVAIMGCLSTLVVSPCITAPLVGVLTYIGDTGSAVLGGFALFMLGLGSGIPLLIVGTSAGKWLPKAGSWMRWTKIILGIMMLIMAAWLLLRTIPDDLQFFQSAQSKQSAVIQHGDFQILRGMNQLDEAILQAKRDNKFVMVDFDANWCLSCKEMTHLVFTIPQVRSLLAQFIVLRVDLTSNNAVGRQMKKRFQVIAPPTFLFLAPNGRELVEARIMGQMNGQVFIDHLKRVLSMQRSQVRGHSTHGSEDNTNSLHAMTMEHKPI